MTDQSNQLIEAKKRQVYLTSEDLEEYEKITANPEKVLEDPGQLNELIVKLRKNYEVRHWDFSAFRGRADKRRINNFFSRPPLLAALAYLNLLAIAVIASEVESRNQFLFEQDRIGWDFVNELEEELVSGRVKKRAFELGSIAMFGLMLSVYTAMDDVKRISKVYQKILSLSSNFEPLNEGLSILNTDVGRWFSSLFGNYLNEVAFLIEGGRTVFGNNPKLVDIFIRAMYYGQDDEPCLIIGETGTGKEIVAKLMHCFSPRKLNNFIARNCGNLTPTLFDAELQGTHWSAATDTGTRLGLFLSSCGRVTTEHELGYCLTKTTRPDRKEIRFTKFKIGLGIQRGIDHTPTPTESDLYEYRGTTFLDEIDSIPMELQSKLLRIIQEKEVYINGEDKIRKFQSKIICATNKDPRLMEKGSVLREDLLYRVNRGIVEVPPLRKMKESIAEITHFIIRNDQMNLGMGKKRRKSIKLSDSALEKLVDYDWPGNHRELENVIYRALKTLLFEDRKIIEAKDIDLFDRPETGESYARLTDIKYEDFKRAYMKELMERTGGNKSEAARISGLNRGQLYTRLEECGLFERRKETK